MKNWNGLGLFFPKHLSKNLQYSWDFTKFFGSSFGYKNVYMYQKLSSTADCRLKYLQNNPREAALAMIAIVKKYIGMGPDQSKNLKRWTGQLKPINLDWNVIKSTKIWNFEQNIKNSTKKFSSNHFEKIPQNPLNDRHTVHTHNILKFCYILNQKNDKIVNSQMGKKYHNHKK